MTGSDEQRVVHSFTVDLVNHILRGKAPRRRAALQWFELICGSSDVTVTFTDETGASFAVTLGPNSSPLSHLFVVKSDGVGNMPVLATNNDLRISTSGVTASGKTAMLIANTVLIETRGADAALVD